MHPWHHYVALGDSFTEGVGDPVEGFARLGVVDRLAAALRQSNPDLRFTNLAQHGLGVGETLSNRLASGLATSKRRSYDSTTRVFLPEHGPEFRNL